MTKKILFYFILILLPILFLAILESLLVIFDYGTRYPLVIEEENNYRLNQDFPQKYFSKKDIITPQLIDQVFPKQKNKNAFRLICLGGSTTAGFPYEVNINFPYFIKSRLQWLFPNKNIEVINLGISAINSYAVLDLLPEIIKLDPDVLLIYMGHNEFYGALGLASVESISSNRTFIKLYLELKKFRTYQLLRSSIWKLMSVFKSDASFKKQGTLMKEVVRQSQIPYKSEVYRKTLENFQNNLEDIASFFSANNIPVLISNIVSNIKDQPPLGKDEIRIDDENLRQKYEKAKEFERNNNFQLANEIYSEIIAQDSLIPSVFYNSAKCYYNLLDFKKAERLFKKTRDYDVMRFRAPGEINSIIKKICDNSDAIFVSTESIFQSNSENGIPGKNLFLEHLHPNVKGYYLIAASFIEEIKDNELLCEMDKWPFHREKTNEQYLNDSGYTLLDVLIGELKVKGLVAGFPFNGISSFEPTFVDNKNILKIADEHVVRKIYWDEAHYKLGKIYEDEHKYVLAQNEYEAVQKVMPENYLPYFKIGDLYYKQQNWGKAIEYYNQSVKYNPTSIYTHAKLGKTYIMARMNSNGIQELEQIVKMEKQKPQLTQEMKLEINYLIGLAYARIGDLRKAIEFLNNALSINSKYQPALKLLMKIRQ